MKENIKKNALKNSSWNFLATLSNRIGGLIFTIILARFLLPENFGVYSIVISVAMIFFTFADLGVNGSLVRYLSFSLAKEKSKAPSYYRYLLKLKLIFALIASVALLIFAYPIAFSIYKNPALFQPIIVCALYIFVLSFENFYSQLFYASEHVKYMSIKEFLHQSVRIILAFFVFYFVTSSYQIIGIIMALILTTLVMIIFVIYYTSKLIPNIYKKPKQDIDKKRIRKFLGFLTIASISSVFFSYIDSLMLGFFTPAEFVGYYRASFSLVFGVIGLASFSNLIFLPVFTKLKKEQTCRVLNSAFKYISLVSIPAVFGVFILGKYFVKILYGQSYLPASLSLQFLSFLIFPAVSIGLFLSLFSAEEKPQIFAKLIIISSIINIILNYVLIKSFLSISPIWATAGAAIATLISWIFYFISSVYAIKKDIHISLSLKPVVKPLIASILMSAAILLIMHKISDINLFTGALIIAIGFLIYCFLIFVLDKELKNEIIKIIKNESKRKSIKKTL